MSIWRIQSNMKVLSFWLRIWCQLQWKQTENYLDLESFSSFCFLPAFHFTSFPLQKEMKELKNRKFFTDLSWNEKFLSIDSWRFLLCYYCFLSVSMTLCVHFWTFFFWNQNTSRNITFHFTFTFPEERFLFSDSLKMRGSRKHLYFPKSEA